MNIGRNAVLVAFFAIFQLQAKDIIKVHNESDFRVLATIYCKSTNPLAKELERKGDIVSIDPEATEKVIRPGKSLKCKRHLVIAFDERQLPNKLTKNDYAKLASIGVGITSGKRAFDNFYVTQKEGRLKVESPLTWVPKKVTQKLVTDPWDEAVLAFKQSKVKDHPLITQNPYDNYVAHVRIGTDVPQQEATYLKKRRAHVQTALESFLGRKLNGTFVPNISVANSGGGARALISSIGFHVGAQKTGLLDTITYDAGVSGGSWFVALWLLSGMDPASFKAYMEPVAALGLNPKRYSKEDIQRINRAVMVRSAIGQPVTLVTVWGAMLGNRYLAPYGNRRENVLFSSLANAQHLTSGSFPFPILTAVNGYDYDVYRARTQMDWFLFTPFEAGGAGKWLGNRHIPMWSVGRTFDLQGSSLDFAPEYDAGQLMGICGSAFAVSYARAYEETVKSWPVIGKAIHYLITKLISSRQAAYAQKKRASAGKIPNFAKGAPTPSIVNKENLKLIDAGLAFNLPTPAVLHPPRKADIIIMFDASGSLEKGASELKFSAEYAAFHKLPFPKVDPKLASKQSISIFNDVNNKEVPSVIYLPRITDKENVEYQYYVPEKYTTDLPTTKFQYDSREYDNLSAVTEANVTHNIEAIKQEISRVIEAHGGFAD